MPQHVKNVAKKNNVITKGSGKNKANNKYNDFEALQSRIQDLREQYNYSLAEQELLSVLEQVPNDTRVLDLLGEVYIENADAGHAVTVFQKSIKLAPEENFSKYMHMGQLVGGKEALEYFNKGLQILQKLKMQNAKQEELTPINKDIASGCCAIAELFMTDLCFENNAEQECERALMLGLKEDGPNNVQLLQTMASLRLCQKNENEARVLMSKVVEQLLDNAPSDYNKPLYDFRMSTVKILIELNQLDLAEKLVLQLLAEYDQVTDAWYLYGVVLREKGDFNTAVIQMTKAIEVGKAIDEDINFLQEIQADMKACMEELQKSGGTLEEYDDDEDVLHDDGDEDWIDEDDEEMQ